jgi:hypothetical protein
MTPANSHKWSSISSAATLENLHINTCITENTSIKRVNTTLLPLQVEMGVAKQIPQLQPKAKERKSKK